MGSLEKNQHWEQIGGDEAGVPQLWKRAAPLGVSGWVL